MKKNFLLASLLSALLAVTWLLTEKKVFEATPITEKLLQEALTNARRIKLPNAELSEEKGVWRLTDGEMARADYLQELHKSLEQLKVSRTIKSSNTEEFFTNPVLINLGQTEVIIGDLTATGESFYLKISGGKDVSVVDLQQMGSLAMADDDNLLQREKYNRLRDLILLPAPRWREIRLVALTQFVAFKNWQASDYFLSVGEVTNKPWGMAIIKALQAGISSLEVSGNIINEKPKKHSKIDDWVFTLDDQSLAVWEFYNHPDVELIYVWIPRLGKGYPLDQGSSDFIKGFVPKLINKPFQLTIYPQISDSAELIEGNEKWDMTLENGEWISNKAINKENAHSMLAFFSKNENFDYLSLLSAKDCQKIQDGANFKVKIQDDIWGVLKVKGALVFLECSTRIALGWSLPLDSSMDFASLRDQ